MDDAAVLFLIDLQRKNGAYQLRDYVERLRVDIGVVVHESSLCRIFQKLGLTIKKPDIVRLERFCRQDGELGGGTRGVLMQRLTTDSVCFKPFACTHSLATQVHWTR